MWSINDSKTIFSAFEARGPACDLNGCFGCIAAFRMSVKSQRYREKAPQKSVSGKEGIKTLIKTL